MIDIEKLKILPPPYEIYEFVPCQPAYFKIVEVELGRMTITPKFPGAPPRKEILAIRLHVDPRTKPFFPHYWDITPARLVYQLAAMLLPTFPAELWLRIHRDITGPKANFSVGWVEKPP